MNTRGTDAKLDFMAAVAASLNQDTCLKLILSKYQGSESALLKISMRPVILRDETQVSCVRHYQTRETTENYPIANAVTQIAAWLDADFKHAHLHTTTEEWQLLISKKGKMTLQHRALKTTLETSNQERNHDHQKQRLLTLDRPFLHALGVTNKTGELIPAMARKWKQINKFLEIFSHALQQSHLKEQKTPLHVLDFGSGKGYLTFAVHDFLQHAGIQPSITGVELRRDMVELCQQAINHLDIQGLSFYQGDVRSYQPEALDIMIALHACDIATDYAIHTGIRLNAAIIMCAPCCHKEIRPQLRSPVVLQPLLQHGVHLGQEAEMVTDGLRALLLEACGYQTQVFEFVSLEHTSKNKMILAVKRQHQTANTEVMTQIQAIKTFYGIQTQCLENLLCTDGQLKVANSGLE